MACTFIPSISWGNLFSDNVFFELKDAVSTFAPLYKLLLEVHEKSIEKGDLYE